MAVAAIIVMSKIGPVGFAIACFFALVSILFVTPCFPSREETHALWSEWKSAKRDATAMACLPLAILFRVTASISPLFSGFAYSLLIVMAFGMLALVPQVGYYQPMIGVEVCLGPCGWDAKHVGGPSIYFDNTYVGEVITRCIRNSGCTTYLPHELTGSGKPVHTIILSFVMDKAELEALPNDGKFKVGDGACKVWSITDEEMLHNRGIELDWTKPDKMLTSDECLLNAAAQIDRSYAEGTY
jgi:hypothetical protein